MSQVAGSSNVVIADIQPERVAFATGNGFAHSGFTVSRKLGRDISEKLQIAKKTAALAVEVEKARGSTIEGFDTVFECTGVEACTQAAIYVSVSHHLFRLHHLTLLGNAPGRESGDGGYGHACPNITNLSSCVTRSRSCGDLPICKHVFTCD